MASRHILPNHWEFLSYRECNKIRPLAVIITHIQAKTHDAPLSKEVNRPLAHARWSKQHMQKELKRCLSYYGSNSVSPKPRFSPQSQPPVFKDRVVGAHVQRSLEEVVRMDLIVYAAGSLVFHGWMRRRRQKV
jgi:hypothetical protein